MCFSTDNHDRGKHVLWKIIVYIALRWNSCRKIRVRLFTWMSFIKAAVHRERKINSDLRMEGWMYLFFYPLSPSSLIFCQHRLCRVTHGNKEAEREVILLAACRSNNLFCGPSGFSRTLKAALLSASRLTLKCCFHPHIPGKAECLSH